MKVRMSNDEMIQLYNACEQALTHRGLMFKHMYSLNRTKDFLRAPKESTEGLWAMSDDYKEFASQSSNVVSKYAKKKEDGSVVLSAMNYPVFEGEAKKKKCSIELQGLRKKFKDVIAKQLEGNRMRDRILSTYDDYDIHTLLSEDDFSNLPLDLLVQTRRIYSFKPQDTKSLTLRKEEILAIFIFAKQVKTVVNESIAKMIVQNLVFLQDALDAIVQDKKYTDFYLDYEQGRQDLLRKHAERDIFDEVLTKENQAGEVEVVLSDIQAYDNALKKYQESKKDIITEFENLRKKEVDVNVIYPCQEILDIINSMKPMDNSLFNVLYPFLKYQL